MARPARVWLWRSAVGTALLLISLGLWTLYKIVQAFVNVIVLGN